MAMQAMPIASCSQRKGPSVTIGADGCGVVGICFLLRHALVDVLLVAHSGMQYARLASYYFPGHGKWCARGAATGRPGILLHGDKSPESSKICSFWVAKT